MDQLYQLAQQDQYEGFINHFKTLRRPLFSEIINKLVKLKVDYLFVEHALLTLGKSIINTRKYLVANCNIDVIRYLSEHNFDFDNITIGDVLINDDFEVVNHFLINSPLGSKVRTPDLFKIAHSTNLILLDHFLAKFGPNVKDLKGDNLLFHCVFKKLPASVIEVVLRHRVSMYGNLYLPIYILWNYKDNISEGDKIFALISKYGYDFNYRSDYSMDEYNSINVCFNNCIKWPTHKPLTILLKNGFEMNNQCIEFIKLENPQMFQYLIEHYYIVEKPRKGKCNEFILACVRGDIHEVKKLSNKKHRYIK